MCHGSPNGSKSSTPDTNKINKSELTCMKCFTSLSYHPHGRPTSPTSPYHHANGINCDACNVIAGYQVYDNFYYVNGINYDNQINNNKKKKLIKLQDCTTWLALNNKVTYEHQYSKFHLNNQATNNLYRNNSTPTNLNHVVVRFQQEQATFPMTHFRFSHLSNQVSSNEKINMLLNRKSTRVNT